MREDLIERLRNFEGSDALGNGDFSLLHEAAAALEAAREDAWRPIETAPKDGTCVLLWFEWYDKPVVGDFRHGRWWSTHTYGGNLTENGGKVLNPTHWRPLPAPPAIDQARGKGVADA